MPASRKAKHDLKAKRLLDDKPKKDDVFAEGYTWAEFESHGAQNNNQARVDLAKPDQVWFYLGKTSTEARAQYTENPAEQRNNPKSNFLDSIPKPPKPAPVSRPAYHHQSYVAKAMAYSYKLAANHVAPNMAVKPVSFEKPYIYKPKNSTNANVTTSSTNATFANQHFMSYNSSPAGPAPAPVSNNYTHHNTTFAKPGMTPSQHMAVNPARTAHQPMPQAYQYPRQPVSVPFGQQTKPSWQIHSSVYQKYPFFQVNRNR